MSGSWMYYLMVVFAVGFYHLHFMIGWTLWRRWWKVQQFTPSHISQALHIHSQSLSISPPSLFYGLAYLPTNALSWSLGHEQLLMYVIIHWKGSYCMFMDWSESPSNRRSSAKMWVTLYHLKVENPGGWNDDGPRGEKIALLLVCFSLVFIEQRVCSALK